MKFEITVAGDFPKQWGGFIKKYPGTVFNAIREATFWGLKTLKQKTPRKTGHARRGWLAEQVGKFRFEIYNLVPYIGILEDGAKAHKITATTGKALVWKKWPAAPIRANWVVGGGKKAGGFRAWAFRSVQHPGFRGFKMVATTKPQIITRARGNFTQELRALINNLKLA